jgi:hypothetical protein
VLDGLGATRVPLFEDIEALNAAHRRLLSFEMARHHARWFPRFADRYRPRTAGAIRYGLAVANDDAAQIRAGRANVRARIHEAMDASVWTPGCAPPRPAPHPRDWNRPGTRRCSCRGHTPGCRS